MAIFRCKMCGGDLVVNQEMVAICEYCNTKQTLPKPDDDLINDVNTLLDNKVVSVRGISDEFNIEIVNQKASQVMWKFNKVLNANKVKNKQVLKNVEVRSNDNVLALVRRIFMFLEDRDFKSADSYCERVLDIEPENEEAYLGKLMVSLLVSVKEDLKFYDEDFSYNVNYKKIMRYGSKKLKDEIGEYLEEVKIRIEKEKNEKIYQQGMELMNGNSEIDSYKKAIDEFKKIIDYKDSKDLIQECEGKINCLINDKIYDEAKEIMDNYLTVKKYLEAISMFEQIPGWRDSDNLVVECKTKLSRFEIEEEKIFIRNFRIYKGVCVVFCIVLLIFGSFNLFKDAYMIIKIRNDLVGKTFEKEQDDSLKNNISYYGSKKSIMDKIEYSPCIDSNGYQICSVYTFVVDDVYNVYNIYFDDNNKCDITFSGNDGEKIYNDISYKISYGDNEEVMLYFDYKDIDEFKSNYRYPIYAILYEDALMMYMNDYKGRVILFR